MKGNAFSSSPAQMRGSSFQPISSNAEAIASMAALMAQAQLPDALVHLLDIR